MIRTLQGILFGSAMIAVGNADAAGEDAHRTSAHISAAIAAGLPKFVPKRPGGEAAGGNANIEVKATGAAAGITLMSRFTVREAKLPAEERMLSYKGRARIAMDEYLGDSDGLDRGVLNRFTLAQLWGKIPILGRLPFVGTGFNMGAEERAFDAAGENDPLGRPQPPRE